MSVVCPTGQHDEKRGRSVVGLRRRWRTPAIGVSPPAGFAGGVWSARCPFRCSCSPDVPVPVEVDGGAAAEAEQVVGGFGTQVRVAGPDAVDGVDVVVQLSRYPV